MVAGCFGVLLSASAHVAPPFAGAVILATGAILLGCAATIDLSCRQHLGASPFTIYRYVRHSGSTTSLPKLARTYFRPFVPPRFLAAVIAAFLAMAALAHLAIGSANLSLALAVPACLLALLVWALLERAGGRRPLLPEETAFLLVPPEMGTCELRAADRSGRFRLAAAGHRPETILIIINESAGQWLPASDAPGTRLAERIRKLSGHPADWLEPSNVVTNSACTEVSVPSLLTGVGTHESAEALHRMPFVFDLAKARGYRTALLMASTLEWSNLDRFFSTAAIDDLYAAETEGHPLVNDIGIDDAYPVEKLEAIVAETRGPLFAVLFLNALHVPFQAESRFPIPASLQDRRSRALSITETAHRRVFDALKRAGRYDDALILSIADHGERPDHAESARAAISRLENYSDWVLRTLFLVKPPRHLPEAMAEALRGNGARLIANVDIAPTLADLLGVALDDGLAYCGHSLFQPIPPDRVSVATSTNECRSWFGPAIALARGRERLTCDRFDFLRYESGAPPDPATDAPRRASLIAEALRTPIINQTIARIYRTHF
ncbi:sulfatase-like hydrolase/transferase [Xanthobacter autotrophicus]|uniref:sulfatase-like hydrolase/transferase n=1 Tax=Xanthobacter autotrophicus TaxID=280 RepID=UPI0037281F92